MYLLMRHFVLCVPVWVCVFVCVLAQRKGKAICLERDVSAARPFFKIRTKEEVITVGGGGMEHYPNQTKQQQQESILNEK